MVRVLFTALIGALLSFAVPKGSEAACMFNCTKGKNVTIQSGSGLEGYQDIIAGKQPKPFAITGKLYVPGECSADKKLPAVIIQHGSGMPSSDWYYKLSEALNKSGIIALVPDSHTARGITGTGKDQSQLSKADRLYDTFSAFNFLETIPCVDKSRVGITGYSFGGIIAMDSVETVLASKLAKGKTYKASLPVYPACQATFKNTSSTNTKVHLLVGELDDYTSAKYCLEGVEFKKQRGWNIDITVLEGAHHGFNHAGGPKSKQSWTFDACGPIEIDENGFQIITKYGFSTKDGWKKFVGDAVKTCAKRGVTVGGTEKTSKFTLDYTVEFFTAALDVTKTSGSIKTETSTNSVTQESTSGRAELDSNSGKNVRIETVNFQGAKSENKRFPAVSNVRGELRLPDIGNGKFPAVVLLHSSGGYKASQAEYYAEALNAAGIATLEVDMFAKGKRPRRTDLTMSHAFGALEYLKSRPEIDADKIGVTGWSWGGVMSLRMASERLHSAFGVSNGKGFKAFAPFYGLCFTHINYQKTAGDYDKLTGHPVKIFYSGKDDYDNPENCPKFLKMLPKESQNLISLEFYPDATHGWDALHNLGKGTLEWYDQHAHDGKGGTVYGKPNKEFAEDSRRKTVEFFATALDVTKTSMPTKTASSTKQVSQESYSKPTEAACAFNCEDARKARAGYQNVNQVDAQLKIINDKSLCRNATDENGNWESIGSYKKFVDEAKDRGLDLQKCAALIRPVAKNNVASGSSSTSSLSKDPSPKIDKTSQNPLDTSLEENEIKALEKKLEALKQKAARKGEYLKLRKLLDQKLRDIQDQYEQKLTEIQEQIRFLDQEYKDVLN